MGRNVNQALTVKEDQGARQQPSDTSQSSDNVRDETRTTLITPGLMMASHFGILMIILYLRLNMSDKASDKVNGMAWCSLMGLLLSLLSVIFVSCSRLPRIGTLRCFQCRPFLPLLNIICFVFTFVVWVYVSYVLYTETLHA